MSDDHQEPGSGIPHLGPAPARPVTIKDVAAHAGVAQGTVSNVLNNPEMVRPPTRRRVEEAIAKLGYIRNESARQLRMGTSRTIALVVPDIANPFFDDVAAGADDAADAADAMVMVCSSANSATREERHLRRLDGQRLLGVAITPLHEPPWQLLEDITAHGTPVVFIDFVPASSRATVGVGPSAAAGITAVTVDDHLGGFLAGQHLLEAGHRRIVFLAPVFQQTQDRLAGLREAVGEQGRIDVVRCAAMTIDAGARAARELLSGPGDSRPTAIFCGNDLIAVGVLGECQRRGVRVPQDLALVGYDDVDIAVHMSVPLTTIRQPRHLLGARAVKMLLGEAVGERLSVFQPDLVVRASSPVVWIEQQPR